MKHRWTNDDIVKLKEIFENTRNEEISVIMDIGINAIISKANKLNLTKSKEHKSKMISKRNKMITRDLSYDLLKEISSKYKTRGEFQRLDGSAYTTARVSGVLDEICSHMIKGNYSIPQLILFYIIDKIFNTEIIYNTRKIIKPYELDIFIPEFNLAFEYDGKAWHNENSNDELKNKLCIENSITLIRLKENSRDYIKDVKEQFIENLSIINDITKLNIIPEFISEIINDEIYEFVNNHINDEYDIIEIINKYNNYHEFKINEEQLYQKLLRRGMLEKYTINLERDRTIWNIEMIKNEISKYEYLLDFIEKSHGCYIYCKRNNMEYLFEKLKRKNRVLHNIEDVKNEISKYEYLSDFREQSPTYYIYIKKHKYYNLIDGLKRKRRN